jgi:DNA-binding NarL/FixJ family response regulator
VDEQPICGLGPHVVRTMSHNVVVCDTQPITVEGLRSLLEASGELSLVRTARSLAEALDAARAVSPAIVVLDKAFGARAVLECMKDLGASEPAAAPVVWAVSLTEPEVLRFMQAGARGILRRSADLKSILACFRVVAAGAAWMDQSVLGGGRRPGKNQGLTPRERQVFELAGPGLKNREIGRELGIRPGTVKVHLKHIFEKTGTEGRYGLALAALAAG